MNCPYCGGPTQETTFDWKCVVCGASEFFRPAHVQPCPECGRLIAEDDSTHECFMPRTPGKGEQ